MIVNVKLKRKFNERYKTKFQLKLKEIRGRDLSGLRVFGVVVVVVVVVVVNIT